MSKLLKICCFFILLASALPLSAHDFYGDYFRYRSFTHYPGFYSGFGGRYVHDYYSPYRRNSLNYLAPAILGGVVGYTLAQPRVITNSTVYITPQVIYTPPQAIYSSPEVIYSSPQVILNSVQPVVYSSPVGHRYESILDSNCKCYRTILVAD